MVDQLDKLDRAILMLLQANAHLTMQEIGQRVNLSKTPVHERIKRLEREGIIQKYVTLVDRNKLGNALIVYCQVTLDRQTRDAFVIFDAVIDELPEMLECSRVSGAFDYLLKIVVRDMAAYNRFYQEKFSVIPGILHISSFFVMEEIKHTTVIPV